MQRNKDKKSGGSRALRLIGFLFSVLPPALAALSYFPLWRSEGSHSSLSGICALLLCLSAVPICKYLARKLASPAAYMLWLIIFLVFFFLSRVADEMTVIAFTGFVGNLIGALCFKLSEGKRNEE